jgi:DNA polymerase
MFVGEGPGADEDKQGRPFVGRAGKLLDKMIEAMGLTRDEVFIANVVKCRPPGNRVPRPGEAHACLPYLKAQIAAIEPEVICCLGKTAAYWMVQGPEANGPMKELRGAWHGPWDRGEWSLRAYGWVRVTYHPAYLLRNPAAKAEAWQDLQAIVKRLDEAKKRGQLQFNRFDVAESVRHRGMNWKEVTVQRVEPVQAKRGPGRPRKSGRDGLRPVELVRQNGFGKVEKSSPDLTAGEFNRSE